MARIRDYETQESVQGNISVRRVEGSDLYAGGLGTMLADGVRGLVTDIKDSQQRQEVSDVNAVEAERRAKWTVEMENRAASMPAGDPTFADKFVEDFTADIAPLGDKYQTAAGRRAFQQKTRELSAYFVAKAGVYQAASAGAKATQDYLAAKNFNRSALLVDPAQFQSVVKETTDALNDPDGPYAKIPSIDRVKLERTTKEDLAESAVEGTIRQDPERGLAELASGRWGEYLSADRASTLTRTAEIGIRAKEIERARIEAAAEKAADKARQATADSFLPKIFGQDGVTLTTQEILRSNLKPEQKEHYLNLVQRVSTADTKLKTDPAVMIDLFQRINLPDGDPNKIVDETKLDAYFGKGLDMTSLSHLRGEMQGRRTEEGRIEADLKKGLVDAAKTALTGTNSLFRIRDPNGDVQLQKFMSYFLPEYQRQRQAGKTAAELLDPDSPSYLGKAIDRFKRSPTQMMQDMIQDAPALGGQGAAANLPVPPTAPAGATKTAVGAGGSTIYLVNGKWVDASGKPVQ